MAKPIVSFFVYGIPAPGGSKTAKLIYQGGRIVMRNGRPLITMRDDAKGNADWKRSVKFFAVQAYRAEPLTGPLEVWFSFVVVRPKCHYGSGKNAGNLKSSAPDYPCVNPDVTKLIRSTEDALTGILWRDDKQIVHQVGNKKYGTQPGCQLDVYELGKGGRK